jgi:hypothetical protein
LIRLIYFFLLSNSNYLYHCSKIIHSNYSFLNISVIFLHEYFKSIIITSKKYYNSHLIILTVYLTINYSTEPKYLNFCQKPLHFLLLHQVFLFSKNNLNIFLHPLLLNLSTLIVIDQLNYYLYFNQNSIHLPQYYFYFISDTLNHSYSFYSFLNLLYFTIKFSYFKESSKVLNHKFSEPLKNSHFHPLYL